MMVSGFLKSSAIGLLAAATALAVAPASAQDAAKYPARAVKLIIPFSPGGGTDGLGRMWAQYLTEKMGQSFVVENIAGAGGNIGMSQAARAAPDGYTLVAGTPGIALNPLMQVNIPYDTLRDFQPIMLMTASPIVIVTRKGSPLNSVKDLIDLDKAKPGSVNFGSAGTGTINHVSAELFNQLAGTKLVHVPYKGTGPALIDLLAGRTDVQFENLPAVLGQIKSGELKAIAVGTRERSPFLPGIPTVIESGVADYDSSSWWGFLAPAKTPQLVVDKLVDVLGKALKDPEVLKRMEGFGVVPVGGTPKTFSDFIAQTAANNKKAIEAANIKLD